MTIPNIWIAFLNEIDREERIDRILEGYNKASSTAKLHRFLYRTINRIADRILRAKNRVIRRVIEFRNLTMPNARFASLKAVAVRNSSIDGDKTRSFYIVVPNHFPDTVDINTLYWDCESCRSKTLGHLCDEKEEYWALAPELQKLSQPYAFLTDFGKTAKIALRNYRKHGIEFRLTQ